jgi:hypothetical protein
MWNVAKRKLSNVSEERILVIFRDEEYVEKAEFLQKAHHAFRVSL